MPILIAVCFTFLSANAQLSLPAGSPWHYLKGSQAQSLVAGWTQPDFNPSAWAIGNAPFRYGDAAGGTELIDMQHNYTTIYLLTDVQVQNLNQLDTVDFMVNYDDGFILYINGQVAFSRNAPTTATHSSTAIENHESGAWERVRIGINNLNLTEGSNRISVLGLNVNRESSDFYFDLGIASPLSLPVTPTSQFPHFSTTGGFKTDGFDLTLSSSIPQMSVVYTIDGSNPQTSPTAQRGGQVVTIPVNTNNTTGRANTPGFIVRASMVQEGHMPASPRTENYIFLSRVLSQRHPGYNWPTTNVNGQLISLAMDPRVTTSSLYQGLMDEAFFQIPTLSIVTDMENLFDPARGIYVNALHDGRDWERFGSMQLINSHTNDVLNVNLGLRIRGGYSRNDMYPKRGFRLFFRGEYGFPKLHFPLFEDEGVSEFDKVDLRCTQNYGWNNGQSNALYTRDVFSRDVQRDMGRPYTRSRYYHLFLNGMYWGLYQSQERSEARFAASYLGGNRENYDVVKVDGYPNYVIEATDGNLDAWRRVYNMTRTGFTSNQNYFALEGRDAQGRPMRGAEVLVDIDNLIDYMAIIFYTGNFDAPISAFLGNSRPNNFYAIKDRTDKSRGFIFFCHDSEHSLLYPDIDPGDGINTNRVTLGNLSVSDFSTFNPQWLHHRLSQNEEYRQRFASRAYELLTGNGLLTPARNWARLKARTDEIEFAIIAESARWGDGRGWGLRTKHNDWLPTLQTMQNQYFPQRTDIVISQLQAAGLFPSIDAPVLTVNSTNVAYTTQTLPLPVSLSVTNPRADGTIYYTLNGSDPRSIGGGVSAHAIQLNGTGIAIDGSTVVRARVLSNNNWSALVYVNLISTVTDYSNLRVTEISYNPNDTIAGEETIDGRRFEFLEIKNIGSTAVALGGMSITSAIDYTFPMDALLAPGGFFVVASDPTWFFHRYGMVASGQFDRNLSSEGELVSILAPNNTPIIEFSYSSTPPWPQVEQGYTLHASEANPTLTPDNWEYWKQSKLIGGSPFSDDDVQTSVIAPVAAALSFTVFPNPATESVEVSFNGDGLGRVELYNMLGNLAYTGNYFSGQHIVLSSLGLGKGLYALVLRYNGQVATKRIQYAGP